MQPTLAPQALGNSDLESKPAFSVVIAYEDFETGKHAKRTYEYLVKNLGSDCEFTNQMWKFDVLSIPKLREIAARDAASADVILISCHGGLELPAEVKAWVNAWSSATRNAIALVALFDCDPNESRPIRNYLSEVAMKCRLEFFTQPDESSEHKLTESQPPFRRGSVLGERTLSTLAGVVQADPGLSRWGLNE